MLGRTPFICDSIGNFSIVHSFRFVQSARSATMNQYRRIESDLTKSKTIELNAVYWAVPVVQCGIHCRVLPSFCRSSQYQYQMIWIFILLYRLRSGNRPTDRHRRKETAASDGSGGGGRHLQKISELVCLISLLLCCSGRCRCRVSHKCFSNFYTYSMQTFTSFSLCRTLAAAAVTNFHKIHVAAQIHLNNQFVGNDVRLGIGLSRARYRGMRCRGMFHVYRIGRYFNSRGMWIVQFSQSALAQDAEFGIAGVCEDVIVCAALLQFNYLSDVGRCTSDEMIVCIVNCLE